MIVLARILIALAFLTGSYASVTSADTVMWGTYSVALAVGLVGVIFIVAANRLRSLDSEGVSADVGLLRASIASIVTGLRNEEPSLESTWVYDLPAELDRRFVRPLAVFADNREAIVRLRGVQAYADVMSHFAAGERYLNRAWCSAADGYIDEAHRSLQRAIEEFDEVAQKLGE